MNVTKFGRAVKFEVDSLLISANDLMQTFMSQLQMDEGQFMLLTPEGLKIEGAKKLDEYAIEVSSLKSGSALSILFRCAQ